MERVSDGLLERDEEARLVVLSMIAMEHILLLGVPGTEKSESLLSPFECDIAVGGLYIP